MYDPGTSERKVLESEQTFRDVLCSPEKERREVTLKRPGNILKNT